MADSGPISLHSMGGATSSPHNSGPISIAVPRANKKGQVLSTEAFSLDDGQRGRRASDARFD